MSAKVTAADVCVMERLRVGEAIGPGQSSRHDASTDLPIAVETVSHAEWDLDPLASYSWLGTVTSCSPFPAAAPPSSQVSGMTWRVLRRRADEDQRDNNRTANLDELLNAQFARKFGGGRRSTLRLAVPDHSV